MADGNQKPYTKLIAMLADHLRLVLSLSAVLGFMGTGLWWAFGDRITEAARDLVGTNEIKAELIVQGVRLDETRDAVRELGTRVGALEPSPAVAEYDVLRSTIDDVCYPGQRCTYSYRVRRSDEGSSCGTPTAQRVLVDASGSTYFPQPSPDNAGAQRLSDDWSIVTAGFLVPRRVVRGVAEFSLQLTYPDCDIDDLGRVVVVEESPHLIFEIRDPP
jgi:hypothetical protein